MPPLAADAPMGVRTSVCFKRPATAFPVPSDGQVENLLSQEGLAHLLEKARRCRRVNALPTAGSLGGRAMVRSWLKVGVLPVSFQHAPPNLFGIEAKQRAARAVREGHRRAVRRVQPLANLRPRSDGHPRIEEIVQ